MPIVELHHEQPDGRGYPHGLFGHATPLLARIVHVADAFDAMTSARAYRPAQGESHALAELTRHRGTQFDPEVVDAFMAAWRAQGGAVRDADLAPIMASTRGRVRAAYRRRRREVSAMRLHRTLAALAGMGD